MRGFGVKRKTKSVVGVFLAAAFLLIGGLTLLNISRVNADATSPLSPDATATFKTNDSDSSKVDINGTGWKCVVGGGNGIIRIWSDSTIIIDASKDVRINFGDATFGPVTVDRSLVEGKTITIVSSDCIQTSVEGTDIFTNPTIITPVTNYTVTFDLNGGTGYAPDQTVAAGSSLTKPVDPTRAGYIFDGWYSYGFKWNFDEMRVNGDNTLIAQWTINPVRQYTVNFHLNDGTGTINSVTVDANSLLTEPTDPIRADYRFDGWYTKISGTKWNFGVHRVNGDNDLVAKWVQQFTITFDLNGGELNSSTANFSWVVDANTLLDNPGIPVRDGYRFLGWKEVNGYIWNFAEHRVNWSNTLVAQWVRQWTITFDLNGGELSGSTTNWSVVVDNGELLTDPGVPTRDGYRFLGWKEVWGYTWNFAEHRVGGDNILVAQWIRQWTVNFDLNGGELNGDPNNWSVVVDAGSLLDDPGIPTKDGYRFDGWYTKAHGNKWDFNLDTVDADDELVARWVAIPPVTPVVPTTIPIKKTTPAPITLTRRVALINAIIINDEAVTDETLETDISNNDIVRSTPANNQGQVLGAEDTKEWAVLNLILAILTALMSIIILLAWLGKDKDDDNRHGLLRTLTLVPAVGAVIVFFLTEDWTLPMRFVDIWTWLMAAILVVQIVLIVLVMRHSEHQKQEN